MSGSTGPVWPLGSVSAHYEANGLNAGTVSSGRGDHGGVSYGIYQLSSSSGTVREYLGQSSYGQKFEGLTPATTAFNKRWTDVAQAEPAFGPDQRDFIARSHFQPRIDELKADGIDLTRRGIAVQEALWSTSVQYRGLTTQVVEGASQNGFGPNYRANLDRLSDKDIVAAVQDYKRDHVDQNFRSSSALVRDSIRDRIEHEKQDLVGLAEGRTPDYGHAAATAAVLRQGSHGEEVEKLQGQLARLGYTDDRNHVLDNDGRFGASTRQAVQAFQRDEGLAADGVVGRGTWRLLDRAAAEPQQAPTGAAPSASPARAAPDPSASASPSSSPRVSLHPDGEGAAANPWRFVDRAAERQQLPDATPSAAAASVAPGAAASGSSSAGSHVSLHINGEGDGAAPYPWSRMAELGRQIMEQQTQSPDQQVARPSGAGIKQAM